MRAGAKKAGRQALQGNDYRGWERQEKFAAAKGIKDCGQSVGGRGAVRARAWARRGYYASGLTRRQERIAPPDIKDIMGEGGRGM